MKKRTFATLDDFFIKKDAGAENDNSCLTTSSLADNGKQVFVGIEQGKNDHEITRDNTTASVPTNACPLRDTPSGHRVQSENEDPNADVAAFSGDVEEMLGRKRRRRVTHALFSDEEDEIMTSHVPEEAENYSRDVAMQKKVGNEESGTALCDADKKQTGCNEERFGNDRTPRLLPDNPQLSSRAAPLETYFNITQNGDADAATLVYHDRVRTPREPIVNWAGFVDDSITLCDGGGLPSSQTSGSYGQDDPTPIPIPRRSMPASLMDVSDVKSAMVFGQVPCSTAFITPPLSTASPLESPHGDDLPVSSPHVGNSTPFKSTKDGVNPSHLQRRHTVDDVTVKTVFQLNNAEKALPFSSLVQDVQDPSTKTCDAPAMSKHDNVKDEESKTSCGAATEQPHCLEMIQDQEVLKKRLVPPSSKLTDSLTTSTCGSWFGSTTVTPGTPADADLCSPKFDPAACDQETLLKHTAGRHGQASSSSLRFSCVADLFNKIEALKGSGSGSKKKATVALTNLFRLALWWCPSDLIPLVYLCLNKTAPDYLNSEIGIGETLLLKIVTEVYGRSEKCVKADLEKYEDLGRIAELSRSKMRVLFRPPPVTVRTVFTELQSLPGITGQVSQMKKKEKIKKLLVAAEGSEAKYIIRFLQGRMRMGAQAMTIYQALAFAFVLTRPPSSSVASLLDDAQTVTFSEGYSDVRRSKLNPLPPSQVEKYLAAMEAAVRTALSQVSNVEVVIHELLKSGSASELEMRCTVRSGIPVQPMLAKPTKGLDEIMQRFSSIEFTCEYKYDGERAQIHLLPNGSVALFSRNLETLTEKYPDVAMVMKTAFCSDVTDCILDAEIVAYDLQRQRILPFQVLSMRKRKGADMTACPPNVQVCVFVFDCVSYNGTSLLKLPLIERRDYLRKTIQELPNQVAFARHAEMALLEDVDAFLQEAIEANCEGLMIKTLKQAASYEPSKRSFNWLKLKKDYLDHLTDSVDLVPMGAYLGRGKRAKVYGAYLLGCYNHQEEVYQTICKAGTGFSDDILQALYTQLKDHIISSKDPSYQVDDKMTPDVWFRPCAVWEVRAADLSLSPVHTAAMGMHHLTRGIGLRFPRFVRVRTDKSPEQATYAAQIVEMFENQAFHKVLDVPESSSSIATTQVTDALAEEADEERDASTQDDEPVSDAPPLGARARAF